MLHKGNGSDQDDVGARHLFELAARQDHVNTQKMLTHICLPTKNSYFVILIVYKTA